MDIPDGEDDEDMGESRTAEEVASGKVDDDMYSPDDTPRSDAKSDDEMGLLEEETPEHPAHDEHPSEGRVQLEE